MGIYLDSASLGEIRDSMNYPFLSGVTTNPRLIARALESKTVSEANFLCHLSKIKEMVKGDIFVQTNYSDSQKMIEEAGKIHKILGGQGIIKIPCNLPGLQAMKTLSCNGIRCAATAVFTAMQAYLAMSGGAECVIPYFSRAKWAMKDGLDLIDDILRMIENGVFDCQLLVASIKTPFDVMDLLRQGAHSVTIPIELLGELILDANTSDSVHDFENALEIVN